MIKSAAYNLWSLRKVYCDIIYDDIDIALSYRTALSGCCDSLTHTMFFFLGSGMFIEVTAKIANML